MYRYQVNVAGGTISVDAHGKGTKAPLVIVPGVMSDAKAWDTVAFLLSSEREVHVVNRRGRPPSSNIPSNYSFLMEVEDLKVVLQNLGQPAHVFGWSLGGLIGLHAATTEDSVLSLVLYEPVMPPFGKEHLVNLHAARSRDDFGALVEIVNRDISGYSQDHVEALRSNPEVWARLCMLAAPLVDEIRALNNFLPDLNSYSSLHPAVMMLRGTQSGPTYEIPFQKLLGSINHAQSRVLQGQDHLVHIAAPEILAEAIHTAISGAA